MGATFYVVASLKAVEDLDLCRRSELWAPQSDAMKAALLVALCATASALKPTTRRDVLAKVLTASTAVVPVASFARSEAEMDARSTGGSADEDMKGLLSGYKSDLSAKEKARDRVHVLFFARATNPRRVGRGAKEARRGEEHPGENQARVREAAERAQEARARHGDDGAAQGRAQGQVHGRRAPRVLGRRGAP